MKKKLLSILTLLVAVCSGAWATDEIIFSAMPTAAWSVPASTTDAEITSTYATISGGKMYVTNKQTSSKDLIKNQGEMAFQHTNNDTFFKVVLENALEAGDVISVRMQSRTDTDLGLWFSTASPRPGSEPTSKIVLLTASSQAWVATNDYTVATGDGICGETTFYIYRHTGKSTYFNTFKITRPVAETKCATPTATLGEWDATSSKYTVTLASTTTGATINYSTDNKATYTAYSEALALAPGTTLDAYATKDGLDNSDNMEQFTVPAAPTLFTITYANADGATGIVPAAAVNVEAGTNITLPKNYSMYKDGYTLTGWDDGETTYATGASYTVSANKTLTAVYTENTVSLADRSSAVTIKWGPFTQNLGIPELYFEGNSGFVVSQATVAGKTIDVKLPIDATNGKFKNLAENTWTQVGPGTVFTIPSAKNATISYKQYDNGDTTTPSVTDEDDDDSYVLTAAGTAGKLYYEYIQVVLPKIVTTAAAPLLKLHDRGTNLIADSEDENHYTLDATKSGEIKLRVKAQPYTYVRYTTGTNNIPDAPTLTTGTAIDNISGSSEKESGNIAISNYQQTLYIRAIAWDRDKEVNSANEVLFTITGSQAVSATKEYSTFCSSYDLDFTNVENFEAYVVSKLNENSATIQRVYKVKARTGLILKKTANVGSETKYVVPLASSTDEIATNKMVGVTEATDMTGISNAYILKDGVFQPCSGGTLAAGKAYLDGSDWAGEGTRSFSLVIDGETTSIADVKSNMTDLRGDFFDLQGRRVAQPTKGLYIVNGKKVIIK